MKRFFILLIFSLFSAVFSLSAQTPEENEAKVANLTFEEQVYDLGIIKHKGGSKTYNFEFINTGNAPLVITRSEASCRCLSIKAPRKPIPAGEKGNITVKYTPKERGSFDNKINLFTNGHAKIVTIRVTGEVVK